LIGVPDGKEYIVAAGKGWFADPQTDAKRFGSFDADKGFHRLSTEARLTALASTLLVLTGKAEKVIFTGGTYCWIRECERSSSDERVCLINVWR
jgi:hypothetical protein